MRFKRLEYGWKEYLDDKGEIVMNVAEVGAGGLQEITPTNNGFILKYKDRKEVVKPDVYMIGQRYLEEPEDLPGFNMFKRLMKECK